MVQPFNHTQFFIQLPMVMIVVKDFCNHATEERIAMLQSEVCKLERELNDGEINDVKLSKKLKKSVRKIVKLQIEDEAHLELVNERALKIRMILKEHNLGKVPKQSFCDKVAAKLLKRIKTRLEKDLQDKKKSNEMELKFLWERSIKAIHQCIEIEVNKKLKIGIKADIMKKIEAKENEREIAKHELDKLKLGNVDKKEKKLHLAKAIETSLKEKEKLVQENVELKIKLGREYDEQAEKKRNFMKEHGKIQELSSKIKMYIDSGKQEKLNDLQEKVAFLKSCREKCMSRKVELSSELSRTKDLLSNSRNKLKHCVVDKSNDRMIEEDIESLAREIDMLEEKKASIGSLTAFGTELERQEQEKERLESKLHRCGGALSDCQSTISEHKRDLEESQYTDIDKRYFNQFTQISEMENKNLGRYNSALEKAFMRFHSKKMKKLNKIIRELWQQFYGEQDIDYISILSSSNGAGTCSYSYRTVMQTRNGDIDMYGKCSSSQKVLVSLIVRIALVKTFCLDCRILALDEPTAGFDELNVDRFAAALLRIMEERRGENFQLIVTTYDEHFARLIGRRRYAEKYYRVTKPDNRCSIIEAQEIFD